jgi:hypothetical protein
MSRMGLEAGVLPITNRSLDQCHGGPATGAIFAIRSCRLGLHTFLTLAVMSDVRQTSGLEQRIAGAGGTVLDCVQSCWGLQAEPHQPAIVNRPSRVPCDLPSMIVGVGDISTKSTVRRRVAVSQELSACVSQSFNHDLHIALSGDIMCQCRGSRSEIGQAAACPPQMLIGAMSLASARSFDRK